MTGGGAISTGLTPSETSTCTRAWLIAGASRLAPSARVRMSDRGVFMDDLLMRRLYVANNAAVGAGEDIQL